MLAAQLLLASASAERSPGATRFEALVLKLTAPGVRLSDAVGGSVRGLVDELRALVSARARNAVLETEIGRLRDELVESREQRQQNRRLRLLLEMREGLAPRSIAASVVLSRFDGPTRMLVVDRGATSGVRLDLPVVAWGGAVGRVVLVERRHAKVRLVTDANSGVAAVVQRSRAQGVLLGRPHGQLQMFYVPRFSDVLHGDRVVTSGLDGVFPAGYGLGTVRAIVERPDGTQTLGIEPALDFGAVEEVLILLDPPIAAAESES